MNFPPNTISQIIPWPHWQAGLQFNPGAAPSFGVTAPGVHLFEVKAGPGRSLRQAAAIARFASLAPEMFDVLCQIADGKENPSEIARTFLMRKELQTPHGENGLPQHVQ